MWLFSALPSAGVISTVALKSRIALYSLAMLSMREPSPATWRLGGVLPLVALRVMSRRRAKHEERTADIRQISRIAAGRRLKTIPSIVGGRGWGRMPNRDLTGAGRML